MRQAWHTIAWNTGIPFPCRSQDLCCLQPSLWPSNDVLDDAVIGSKGFSDVFLIVFLFFVLFLTLVLHYLKNRIVEFIQTWRIPSLKNSMPGLSMSLPMYKFVLYFSAQPRLRKFS